jgi:hypothetical protein
MALPLAAIPMILGGLQAAGGIGSLLTNKRPEYEIPDEVLEAEMLAKVRAMGVMPGKTESQANIDLQAANALSSAQSVGRSGEQLQAILGQTATANRGLAQDEANFRLQADAAYQAALMQTSQFKDQAFQMNEFAPFSDRQRLGEDLVGAGVQNIFNAGLMGMGGEGRPPRQKTSPNAGFLGTSQLQSLTPGLLPSGLSQMGISGPTGFPNPLPSARGS